MTTLDLAADTTIRIPPMCMASIPHRVTREMVPNPPSEIVGHTALYWVVRKPEAMAKLNLIVDQGPCDPFAKGFCTTVFNLSPKAVRISRGDSISTLMLLKTL